MSLLDLYSGLGFVSSRRVADLPDRVRKSGIRKADGYIGILTSSLSWSFVILLAYVAYRAYYRESPHRRDLKFETNPI